MKYRSTKRTGKKNTTTTPKTQSKRIPKGDNVHDRTSYLLMLYAHLYLWFMNKPNILFNSIILLSEFPFSVHLFLFLFLFYCVFSSSRKLVPRFISFVLVYFAHLFSCLFFCPKKNCEFFSFFCLPCSGKKSKEDKREKTRSFFVVLFMLSFFFSFSFFDIYKNRWC